MARDELIREIPDEDLEAHVRRRITPEFVEYLRRSTTPRAEAFSKAGGSRSSAEFNYRLGAIDGRNAIIETLDRLLSEATDPEFQ